jgi:hypothetical protein
MKSLKRFLQILRPSQERRALQAFRKAVRGWPYDLTKPITDVLAGPLPPQPPRAAQITLNQQLAASYFAHDTACGAYQAVIEIQHSRREPLLTQIKAYRAAVSAFVTAFTDITSNDRLKAAQTGWQDFEAKRDELVPLIDSELQIR